MEFEYQVIRLKREDNKLINQLLDIASEIHNRKRDDINWFRWKYFDSPFGESICLLAVKNGKIAGEVTFGKYEFINNRKPIPCLISYQTMVHPQHQKKGIFSKLTREILIIAKKEKIELLFNFPNKESYTPFLKLNFTPINHIKNYINISNKISFFKSPTSLKNPFIATKISDIDSDQIELLKKLKKEIIPLNIENTLTPNRNYQYIKWRFFSYPLYNYKLVITSLGFAIVRTGTRGLFNEVQIMDLFSKDKYNKAFILSVKKEIINTLKPTLISINISNSHPINKFLKYSGFISFPHSISFFTFTYSLNFLPYMHKDKWVITATEFHRY